MVKQKALLATVLIAIGIGTIFTVLGFFFIHLTEITICGIVIILCSLILSCLLNYHKRNLIIKVVTIPLLIITLMFSSMLATRFFTIEHSRATNIQLERKAGREFNYVQITPSIVNSKTKAQIKKEVEKMFGNPFYFYVEKYCGIGVMGYCNVYDWEVAIDTDSIYQFYFTVNNKEVVSPANYIYAICLAHELVHYTKLTTDELATELFVFNFFYSLPDPFYKESALYLLYQRSNFSNEDYDFSGYVSEAIYDTYLKR